MKYSSHSIYKMVRAALMLALALILPFLTGQMQQLGNALCLMHIPVILCGFICGPMYGMIVGLTAPLLRFALFGMPPLMPIGIAMCFELAAYGLVCGIMYDVLPKKRVYIYPALLVGMLSGRLIWGLARAVMYGMGKSEFGLKAFMAGAFINAIPGIVLQIILIPILVIAIGKITKDKNV